VIVDQITWINGDAVLEASNTSIRINGLVRESRPLPDAFSLRVDVGYERGAIRPAMTDENGRDR
jgi:hypothetical protein